MKQLPLEIDNFEEALNTVDNRYNEWFQSLAPLFQFLALLSNMLSIGYGFPLAEETRRHSAALYSIAEERNIRRELGTERERLSHQKQAMTKLEADINLLVRANNGKIKQWRAEIESESTDQFPCLPALRTYYEELIEYTQNSSERLIQALKKVSTTGIDSEESMVFNDLEQQSSLVCYIQNRNHLRAELENAKKQRLRVERVRKEVLYIMNFLGKSDPLEAIHIGPFSAYQSKEDTE